MKLEAVRADRMRGGRNKFGPMYKRDRALKQQKKALIRANGLKLEAMSQVIQAMPSELGISSAIQRIHSASKGLPLSHAALPPTDFDRSPFVTSPISMTMPPHGSLSHHTATSPAGPSSPTTVMAVVPAPTAPPPPGVSSTDEESSCSSATACLISSHLDEAPVGMPSGTRAQHTLAKRSAGNTGPCEAELLTSERFRHRKGMTPPRGPHRHPAPFADGTHAQGIDPKVDDQMKLLQNCWSELLILDHIYRQVVHGKEGSIFLVTGQQVDYSVIASQAGATLNNLMSHAQELVAKLRSLQFDQREFVCLKFLVLFSLDVKNLENFQLVEGVQEQVNAALLDYTMCNYPQQTEKFGQLLLRLPEIRAISLQAEEYLYYKHLNGDVPYNNLLIEMLHAKRA
nr:PREDICTED: nuclear receptor subfamily 5 group A member 2 [Camelus bactrianus]